MRFKIIPLVLLAGLLLSAGILAAGKTYTDAATKVKVTGDFADGTGVAVTALDESDPDYVTCKNRLYDLCKRFCAYRLDLVENRTAGASDACQTPSDGFLTVTIPVPDIFDEEELAVYGIDASGGYTYYPGKRTYDGLEFRTDHLGVFALAVPRADGRVGSLNQTEQLLLMGTVALLLFVNGVLLRKLKNK